MESNVELPCNGEQYGENEIVEIWSGTRLYKEDFYKYYPHISYDPYINLLFPSDWNMKLKRIWMQALFVMQYVLSLKQEIPQIKVTIVMVEILVETTLAALLHTRSQILTSTILLPIKQS